MTISFRALSILYNFFPSQVLKTLAMLLRPDAADAVSNSYTGGGSTHRDFAFEIPSRMKEVFCRSPSKCFLADQTVL